MQQSYSESQPLLSVIVPVYNRTLEQVQMTQRCIGSLIALSGAGPEQMEIIVTDDASPNWSALEWYSEPIKVNRNQTNLGFAANCNRGAKRSTASTLLFLNSDTEATPNWFMKLMETVSRHPKAIIGPKLIFPIENDQEPRIQSAGGFYDAAKRPYHRYFGMLASHKAVNTEQQVGWTTGAAIAVPRGLWNALNGFDELYQRAYFEDVDLCERAKRLGAEIWYAPECVFTHKVGQSMQESDMVASFKAARTFQHNRALFHQRHDAFIEPDIASIMSPNT